MEPPESALKIVAIIAQIATVLLKGDAVRVETGSIVLRRLHRSVADSLGTSLQGAAHGSTTR
jgi:hypothetical protein